MHGYRGSAIKCSGNIPVCSELKFISQFIGYFGSTVQEVIMDCSWRYDEDDDYGRHDKGSGSFGRRPKKKCRTWRKKRKKSSWRASARVARVMGETVNEVK